MCVTELFGCDTVGRPLTPDELVNDASGLESVTSVCMYTERFQALGPSGRNKSLPVPLNIDVLENVIC